MSFYNKQVMSEERSSSKFCDKLWQINQAQGRCHENTQCVAGWLEVQMKIYTCNWHPIWVASCRTELLNGGSQYYLWVDNVKTELNCRTLSWRGRIAWWRRKKPTDFVMHHLIEVCRHGPK